MSHGSAAALLLLAAAPAAAVEPVEIERVVAVIRSPAAPAPRVITLSRLEEETRVALVSRGAPAAATAPIDAAALAAGLQWVVDETLLMDEAARLQVYEVDAGEAAAELARFRSRFASRSAFEAFLARTSMSEKEVEAILIRSLRVRRYVDSRVSHVAQVSEGDVTAWLDEHAAELGTRDREVARARLVERRVAAEVKALVRDVRARADVRVLADFGPAGAAADGELPVVPGDDGRRVTRRADVG